MNSTNKPRKINELKLHYEVMELGLALWAKAPDSDLFHTVDRALGNFDGRLLSRIHSALYGLPTHERERLLDKGSDEGAMTPAMQWLEARLNAPESGSPAHAV